MCETIWPSKQQTQTLDDYFVPLYVGQWVDQTQVTDDWNNFHMEGRDQMMFNMPFNMPPQTDRLIMHEWSGLFRLG